MTLPVAILAGGSATRLQPLTNSIPKALIEINGEPFIAHQLRLLKQAGLQEIVICTWYRSDQILAFTGDGSKFGVKLSYSFDGETPLGTGGAIYKALPLIGSPFFVLYGDSFLNCNYQAIELAHYSSQKKGLMTIYRNNNEGDRSNVEFSNGKIMVYDKQNRSSKMKYIDYGLGILTASAFDPFPPEQYLDLSVIYQRLLGENELTGYEVSERFHEIGSFEGIIELETYLKSKMEREASK